VHRVVVPSPSSLQLLPVLNIFLASCTSFPPLVLHTPPPRLFRDASVRQRRPVRRIVIVPNSYPSKGLRFVLGFDVRPPSFPFQCHPLDGFPLRTSGSPFPPLFSVSLKENCLFPVATMVLGCYSVPAVPFHLSPPVLFFGSSAFSSLLRSLNPSLCSYTSQPVSWLSKSVFFGYARPSLFSFHCHQICMYPSLLFADFFFPSRR